MTPHLILASASTARRALLDAAGLETEVLPGRIDEDAVKAAMTADNHAPRDIADALAEAKAARIAAKRPDAMVLGADQVLEHQGHLLSKPGTAADAIEQLSRLRGGRHSLHSSAVIYDGGRPVWRHIGSVALTMRDLSDDYIQTYVDRNWNSIRESVGCYKIEEEGCRLFSRIDGSHFAILGLPLLEILSYLSLRGVIET